MKKQDSFRSKAEYILDQASLSELRAERKRVDALRAFYWKYYFELEYQRRRSRELLITAINESCTSAFRLNRWQRAIKYKYSLKPFSSLGSLSMPGGRFNMGEIDGANIPAAQLIESSSFPVFSALYLASDKNTALQETLGQRPPSKISVLTPQEIALTNPQSESIVSVSGVIEKIIDLRTTKSLTKLVKLTKSFSISQELVRIAAMLGITKPKTFSSSQELKNLLLDPDWRQWPMRFDVPAESQVFGYLVYLAGIDAIVYPSKLTGKDCIAIFPKNIRDSSTYLELDDEAPHLDVQTRVDSSNWQLCEIM